MTRFFCRLIRVCEAVCKYRMSREQLQYWSTCCIHMLCDSQIYLPLFVTGRIVWHQLLHCFLRRGFVFQLSSCPSSWMYWTERYGYLLRRVLKSNKSPLVGIANAMNVRSQSEFLQAVREQGIFQDVSAFEQLSLRVQHTLSPHVVPDFSHTSFVERRRRVELSRSQSQSLWSFFADNLAYRDRRMYQTIRRRYYNAVRRRQRSRGRWRVREGRRAGEKKGRREADRGKEQSRQLSRDACIDR